MRSNTSSIRVGPRSVKALNTTDTTECVLGTVCVKCIGGDAVFSFQQLEIFLWNDEMPVLFLRTNTTVAIEYFYVTWCPGFKANSTAVTSSGMLNFVGHGTSYPGQWFHCRVNKTVATI